MTPQALQVVLRAAHRHTPVSALRDGTRNGQPPPSRLATESRYGHVPFCEYTEAEWDRWRAERSRWGDDSNTIARAEARARRIAAEQRRRRAEVERAPGIPLLRRIRYTLFTTGAILYAIHLLRHYGVLG
jgi:hypothetical protein